MTTATTRERAAIDWQAVRETRGPCPECEAWADGWKPCPNGHRFVDGELPACDLALDEAPCANCPDLATGRCAGCGLWLCDGCGSDRDLHVAGCPR